MKTEDTQMLEANIRSYQGTIGIVVQYYYNGIENEKVDCPLCKWVGSIEAAKEPAKQGHSTIACPTCNTVLGTILQQSRG